LGQFSSDEDSLHNEAGNNKMKYKIALYKSEEGYSVSCPGLPGCWSQGETEEAAIENIQDAIKEYLATTATLADPRQAQSPEIV
jgi:predicted RNase H-like HicB family nuclease